MNEDVELYEEDEDDDEEEVENTKEDSYRTAEEISESRKTDGNVWYKWSNERGPTANQVFKESFFCCVNSSFRIIKES